MMKGVWTCAEYVITFQKHSYSAQFLVYVRC